MDNSASPPNTRPRPRIGRFALIRKIGSGGQGSVYLAHDPALQRRVAVKLLDLKSLANDIRPGELPNEALMAARLQHHHIVAIHDVGHYRGRPYLVFEFVEGSTFRDLIHDDGALPARRALALMRAVLEGMAHAHERDVLHLDLTPRNILLSKRDVVQIMDFGLARLTHAPVDASTVPVGTFCYMAPEQLEEQPPTAQTDVRSLGLILYELLVGHGAITADNIQQAAMQIINRDIDLTPIATAGNMAPITRFLAGALARDPLQRYRNATEMLSAFDEAVQAHNKLESTTAEPDHATVEFMLRRMQRSNDFPALSRSLLDINRLTADDSNATTDQLANVVLRDFALTNKLLKLANSAFYGILAGEVKNISHAISLFGFEHLRIIANSLTLFSHVQDRNKSGSLLEILIRSFVAGLLARHLAQRQKLNYAEESFICGMFQSLGETMTMFYFPEEHKDIEHERQHAQVSTTQATQTVLGITYSQLGAAVTRDWRFPALIVNAIEGVDEDGEIPPPQDGAEHLRNVSCFAHRMCRILGYSYSHDHGDESGTRAMLALQKQFQHSVDIEPEQLPKLARAAMDRFGQCASVLGINPKTSAWCAAARQCIDDMDQELGTAPEPAQSPATQ